jgi:diguanylate cyclase (GGDEF)-like protein
MKAWVKKFLEQFEIDWYENPKSTGLRPAKPEDLSEDRATLLYVIDHYSKNLFETEKHPARKSREQFDQFVKALITSKPSSDDEFFKFRQFFASHRLDEFTYIQNTFDDFKKIIWDFAGQLGEEAKKEEAAQTKVSEKLFNLREAVEANSIDDLKAHARKFIETYADFQAEMHASRDRRLTMARKNLSTVRKKLSEANKTLVLDHLTNIYNRRAFDERALETLEQNKIDHIASTLITLDIDHFKKINDTYGHDMGDFILKEVAKMLKAECKEHDMAARIGGEEFALLFYNTDLDSAIKRVEGFLTRVRKAAFAHDGGTIRFTVSVGIAELVENESPDKWVKRADNALYQAKQTGRDKYVVAHHPPKMVVVA